MKYGTGSERRLRLDVGSDICVKLRGGWSGGWGKVLGIKRCESAEPSTGECWACDREASAAEDEAVEERDGAREAVTWSCGMETWPTIEVEGSER
jgi:hypothetical protein